MDANLIAIASHSIERIIAVLLGGLAVYYGFRLFLVVPVETSGNGKIQLPGISVVLVKAGPGLFFAAFGALVIVTSFLRPIKLPGVYEGAIEVPPTVTRLQTAEPQAQHSVSQQELARVRLAVQTLNCMQRLSATGSKTLSPKTLIWQFETQSLLC